jgi:hypothetical protein
LKKDEIPKEGEFMEKETTHSKAELASVAAIQNESFVRIAILKEQNRLTQARDDTIAEAQINILWEESKQKVAREREIHEKKILALGNETAIHLEIAKEDRMQSLELWEERARQLRAEGDLQKELMEKRVRLGL